MICAEKPTEIVCSQRFSLSVRPAEYRQRGQVRKIENDDARVGRALPDPRHQRPEVAPEVGDLRLDVALGIDGELNDPLPAGTYGGTAPNAMVDVANKGGRNGAYGPDYLQADIRAGWRLRTAKNTLEFIVDVYNITNRTNFENRVNAAAGADRRLKDSFLLPTALRGGSGFPRQAQLGVRYTF